MGDYTRWEESPSVWDGCSTNGQRPPQAWLVFPFQELGETQITSRPMIINSSKHPQENIFVVNLKTNLITIQTMATTRIINKIERNPSGISDSVIWLTDKSFSDTDFRGFSRILLVLCSNPRLSV